MRYIIVVNDTAVGPFRSREAADEYLPAEWQVNDGQIYELHPPVEQRTTMDA